MQPGPNHRRRKIPIRQIGGNIIIGLSLIPMPILRFTVPAGRIGVGPGEKLLKAKAKRKR